MAGHKKKVLIVGAGVAGGIVADVLRQRANSEWLPVAFVDDDPKKQFTIVHGLPVLGNRNCITSIVKKLKISYIVIAMPSASGEVIRRLVEICQKSKVQLKILPGIYDLITGKIKINDIRDVEVEDLLGRSAVTLNINEIANYLRDKVVLITGAGGSIGSEICRQLVVFGPKMMVLLGHGENSIYSIEQELKQKHPDVPLVSIIADIRDCWRINKIFDQYRPAVVFHAAAHKHVPLMEKNQEDAVTNNIQGTRILAEAAHINNTEIFVLISTDKAVNPTSIMGATKRAAEMVIQWMDSLSATKFVAVRFGNVLGSRGSVIPLFKKQITSGGPVTVTHPAMKRYFMTIHEAVHLVIQAGALARGGEIFVLDMGQPIYITELANNLIRLSGYEPGKDIKILYTGIRPGEKYEESLYSEEEQIMHTKHDRIFEIALKKNNFIGLIDMLEVIDQCNYSDQELLTHLINLVGLKQN